MFAGGDAVLITVSISWAVEDGANTYIGAHELMIFKDIFE